MDSSDEMLSLLREIRDGQRQLLARLDEDTEWRAAFARWSQATEQWLRERPRRLAMVIAWVVLIGLSSFLGALAAFALQP